jgi:hypothetical protein
MTRVPWLRTERVNPPFQKRTQASRLSEQRVYTVFSEPNIGFSAHKEARGFSAELGSVVLLRARTRSGSLGGNGRGDPLTAHLGRFIRMGRG